MTCKDRNREYVIFTCLFDHVALLTIAGYVSPIMRFVHVKCHEMTCVELKAA